MIRRRCRKWIGKGGQRRCQNSGKRDRRKDEAEHGGLQCRQIGAANLHRQVRLVSDAGHRNRRHSAPDLGSENAQVNQRRCALGRQPEYTAWLMTALNPAGDFSGHLRERQQPTAQEHVQKTRQLIVK